jgi:GAF domain-containing protein
MFERVIRALNVAYWDWTAGDDQIRVSTALAEMMDFDPGNWSVERLYEWIHPDDRAGFRAALVGYLKSDADRAEFTYRFIRRGNEVRWALLHYLAERDATGRVTRLTGTVSDITEAKQHEAQNRALIARQEASIEVLRAISASPDDPQPVFELIVRHARELCNARTVVAAVYDGALIHVRAIEGVDPVATERFREAFPRPPGQETIVGRVVQNGRLVHISDISGDAGIFQLGRAFGARSFVGVPLLHDGRVIGALALGRLEAGGFSDADIALVESFAEQASLAIAGVTTLRELRARTAELAERNSEYGERIEHQAATIDVLKAMSASPGDPQPVFDLISVRARDICGAYGVTVCEFDGSLLHWRAATGVSEDPAVREAAKAAFPLPPTRDRPIGRAILDRAIIHIRDHDTEPGLLRTAVFDTVKSSVVVPLMRGGVPIGTLQMGSRERGGFSDTQVELLKTFAEQAVIAIGSAETYRALRERTAALAERNTEYGERIEHQSATIDVLKEMSGSPGDAQPVLQLIARRARELCDAETTGIFSFDGEMISVSCVNSVDMHSLEPYLRSFPRAPARDYTIGRAILGRQAIEIDDADADPDLAPVVHSHRNRSIITLPFLVHDRVVGGMSIAVRKPGGLTESQKALARTLAEQASIAIGAATVHRQLQERTAALAQRNSEFGERIEQQAATIDVLKVMSSTPDDTQPVFDLIVRRATELCNGLGTGLFEFDGNLVHFRALYHREGLDPAAYKAYTAMFPMAPTRGSISCRAILDKQIVHIRDTEADSELTGVVRDLLKAVQRSQVSIPLMRDGQAIGSISLGATEPGGFSDSQVGLLQTFAEQAVIAITSVANFRALRERTAELTRSVAELQALEEVLRAVNSSLDLATVLATIINRAVRLSRADEGLIYEFDETEQVFVPRAAYGMTEDRIARLRELRIKLGETWLGRSAVERAPVYVEDVQQDPGIRDAGDLLRGIHAVLAVPLLREDKVIGGMVIRRRVEGGFAPTTVTLMQTFAGQCVLAIENARLFQELAARGEEARRARVTAEATLTDLRRAQDRLVQSEKMASLGQLTAGIAHEIKNPLNFVNNFSDLSVDLLDELHDAVAPEKLDLLPELRAEIDEITATLKGNLEKIAQHGRRADSIVKNMLLHSRTDPSEPRPIDLNATVEEALNLAYHGARAETPGFNITLEKHLDPAAGTVDVFPQEFIRVMLNLIGNGFYAARKRIATAGTSFEPTLTVITRDLGAQVEIRVRDNGTGIPQEVREKIFEPFFTTKPAGEGTGLGLSLSYDIVVKQHNGQLTVDSQIDSFTEFSITLPRRMAGGGV